MQSTSPIYMTRERLRQWAQECSINEFTEHTQSARLNLERVREENDGEWILRYTTFLKQAHKARYNEEINP